MAMAPLNVAPAPAPAKSGGFPWKWVLIGCGGLLLVVALACGGCAAYGYYMTKDLIQFVQSLETNPQIEAEIGKFKVIHGQQQQVQNADQSVTQTYPLKGERGSGKIEVTYKFESMKLKIINKTFINDKKGERISLD